MKKLLACSLVFALLLSFVSCDNTEEPIDTSKDVSVSTESENVSTDVSFVDTANMDFEFSKRDKENSYDQKDIRTPAESENSIDITAEGTYIFTGDINKMITVSVGDEEKVQIVLDNTNIKNENGPCIFIKSGDKVFITLKEGTKNTISDGTGYSLQDGDTDIDGAIFSRADLTINGKGELTVKGNTKHAIVSKDDLNIVSSTLHTISIGVGLNGKDCVKISDASLTLDAGSDGIRSDNAEDADRGFVYIESGKLDITSGNDGIQAETVLKIETADISITANGGADNRMVGINSDESAKGLKAVYDVLINGGKFNIDSQDDSIHANNSISIKNGDFTLKSGDDGIHADTDLEISSGNITISKSYEGLEASRIIVSGGEIDITASDDGLNAAGGNDGSGMQNPNFGNPNGQMPDQNGQQDPNQQGQQPGQMPPEGFDGQQNPNQSGEQPPQKPDGNFNPGGGDHGGGAHGQRPGGMGGDMFGNGIGEIIISGGKIIVDASGDGIDSNGTVTVKGGVTLVSGPTNNGNGALDTQSGATVTGGVFIALGSSGMAQGFSNAENQGAICSTFQNCNGGTSFALCDSNGKVIVSFTPNKTYSSAVVSAPEIQAGNTYTLVAGGTVDGADENGYARNTTIKDGATLSQIEMVTLVFGSGGMGMGGKPGRR